MIIDYILDRKCDEDDGIFNYNPKDFYNYVSEEEDIFFSEHSISKALDYGTEEDVKAALCNYIIKCGYNSCICDYINSVEWLAPEDHSRRAAVYNAVNSIKEDIIHDLDLSIDEILQLDTL